MTTTVNRVNVGDLKNGYYIFGNKGNVWNDECHIGKSDFSGRTLCGVPMLSNNWARIEEVKTIGCPECLKRYNGEPSGDDYIQQLAQHMVDTSN
jgi:hypothetical protein